MNYGKRFEKIRLSKGYESRQKLADKFSEITGTKFHQQTIGRFEREEYEPSLDQLALYSKALNVSVDYLLGLNDVSIKDAELQSISKTIGLSEDAINNLKTFNHGIRRSFFNKFLNALLEDESLLSTFVICLRKYCLPTEILIDLYHDPKLQNKDVLVLSPEAFNEITSHSKQEVINKIISVLDAMKDKFKGHGAEPEILSLDYVSGYSEEEIYKNEINDEDIDGVEIDIDNL